jgi:hypothetical protein
MNVSITWNPGDTWRKLGYFYYTNSLEFRAVIEQNPQWNVLEEPPFGTVLVLDVDNSRTLSTLNNSGFFSLETDFDIQARIFPFDFQEAYDAQAAKYSVYSLINYNQINGYTQDTQQAITGNL